MDFLCKTIAVLLIIGVVVVGLMVVAVNINRPAEMLPFSGKTYNTPSR